MLNQILLFKMPDIYQIASNPQGEETFEEMSRILELLLGLAIKGDNHAKFIHKIQHTLSEQTQAKLIDFIKEVNDNVAFSVSESIVIETPPLSGENISNDNENGRNSLKNISGDESSLSLPFCVTNNNLIGCSSTRNFTRLKLDELNEFLNDRLLRQVKRVVDERDEYLEMVIELKQDKEQLSSRHGKSFSVNELASENKFHHHLHNMQMESVGSPSGFNSNTHSGLILNGVSNLNSDKSNGDFKGMTKSSI